MEEALENRDFQISTAIFAAMQANPTGEHHRRRQSSSKRAACRSLSSGQASPPLGIAHCVDHPQQSLG